MGEQLNKLFAAGSLAAVIALTGCGGGSGAGSSPGAATPTPVKAVMDTNQSCNQLLVKDDESRLIRASTFAANVPAADVDKSQRTLAKISAADLEYVAGTANDAMKPLILDLAKPLKDLGESDQQNFVRDAYAAAEKKVLEKCSTQYSSYQGNKAAKAAVDKAAADIAASKAAAEAAAKAAAEAAAAPKEYSGFGDDVLTITKHAAGPAILVIQHSGGSNFAVHSLDSALENTDLLVNEIGPYSGTVILDGRARDESTALKITAGGAWTISLKPLSGVKSFDGSAPMSGHGDDVFYYKGPSKAATFTHNGSSNIAVKSFGTRSNLLINEIGAYTGTVVWAPGLYQVTADGNWSATLK